MAVAVFVWLAELDWPFVIAAMAIATLIAWTIEWLAWRETQNRWPIDDARVVDARTQRGHVTRVPATAPGEETFVTAPPTHSDPDRPAGETPAPEEAPEPDKATAPAGVAPSPVEPAAERDRAQARPSSWPSWIRSVVTRPNRPAPGPEQDRPEAALDAPSAESSLGHDVEPEAYGDAVAAATSESESGAAAPDVERELLERIDRR